jgi:uncharacterized protein (DUF1499 family)
MFKFSGKRPTNLGVTDGKFAPVPTSPNCVCSQAPSSDAEHYIAPFPLTGSPRDAIESLKAIVQSMDRTTIVESTDSYLYAEFTTKLMGYVDDVEFYADGASETIQVRSASRLGQSDLGLNRQRIEAIRAKL